MQQFITFAREFPLSLVRNKNMLKGCGGEKEHEEFRCCTRGSEDGDGWMMEGFVQDRGAVVFATGLC